MLLPWDVGFGAPGPAQGDRRRSAVHCYRHGALRVSRPMGSSPPQAWDPNPHAMSPGAHCSGKPTGLGLEATCRPPPLGSGCEPRPLDSFWLSSCVCRPLRKVSLSQTCLGQGAVTEVFYRPFLGVSTDS